MSKSSIYQKVLVLNKHWIPVNTCFVGKAISDMHSSKSPKKALQIEYALFEDGTPDFTQPTCVTPLDWDEWSLLDPRPYDEHVIRSTKRAFRVPRVIIAPFYDRVPIKTHKPTNRTLYDMQKGICPYSKKKLSLSQMSKDHIHPQSRGGSSHFENVVMCDKEINAFKGDRTPEEAGLTLAFRNKTPKPVIAQMMITPQFQDWRLFLH